MATGTAAGATTERRRGRRQGRYLFIGRIRLEWWGHLSVGPLVAGTQSLNDEHASLVRSSPPFPNGRRADVHVRYGLHVQGGGGRARTLYREGSSDGIPVETLGAAPPGGVKVTSNYSNHLCRNKCVETLTVSIRLFRYACFDTTVKSYRNSAFESMYVSAHLFRHKCFEQFDLS